MSHVMDNYHNLVSRALNAAGREDRTGVGTQSVFGAVLEYDHRTQGFPLLTTKFTNFRAVVAELLWFLSGSTNVNDLESDIWNEWASKDGELGPVYGHSWKSWGAAWPKGTGKEFEDQGIDQIAELIDGLIDNPYSRRHIVSAWNVGDLPAMNLSPCHIMFQCYVEPDESLSIQVYQRSADLMLGVPFNIASYSLLLKMLAKITGREAGRHIHVFGDAHIYRNHTNGAHKMLERSHFTAPQVVINYNGDDIDEIKPEHIDLVGYQHHPAIKLPVAV